MILRTDIIKYLLLFTIVFNIVSCGKSIDPATLTPIQRALANPDRSSYEKSIDKLRKSFAVLQIAAIQPGMSIADIDAGSGFFTELFSYLVGSNGHVYLQNAQRYVINHSDEIEKRLNDNRLPNVTRIDSSFNDLKLPNNLDLIFISLAFHDIFVPQHRKKWNSDSAKYYPQIYKSLKLGGRVMIIDHSAKDGSGTKDTASLHRIDEIYTINKFLAAGFELSYKDNLFRNQKDERTLSIWDKSLYKKTDRFILIFTKK